MSVPPQTTKASTSAPEKLVTDGTTGDVRDIYFSGPARKFAYSQKHRTSTWILPNSYDDTFVSRTENSTCAVDPSRRHAELHECALEAFKKSLASYARDNGMPKTKKAIDEACQTMAGWHNSRNRFTQIYVGEEGGNNEIVASQVTVADNYVELMAAWPIHYFKIYQGRKGAESEATEATED